MIDIRDTALINSFPVQAVPKYGAFQPLTCNGQRLLIAGNGFFLDLYRDWLYAIQVCAQRDGAIRYPFGEMASQLSLRISDQIASLVDEFFGLARGTLPNECAAAGIYDHNTRQCTLKVCEAVSASPTALTYRPPLLGPTESIAIDIHSHGTLPAVFSAQDDQDDVAAIKLAMCVGHIDRPVPTVSARLCLNGLFVPLYTHSYGMWWLDEHGSSVKLHS